MRSFLIAPTAALLLAALPVAAQPVPLHFEVASIKLSQPGAVLQDMRINVPPGRLEALNITLQELISSLSGFSQKVEGGPKWAASERFDIVAKAGHNITPAERTQMVQTLLEERFQLATHRETKETAGFALVPANPPPTLKPSAEGARSLIRSQGNLVIFQSQSIFALASYLSQILQAPVVDHSRIRGNFDFTLDTGRSPGDPFPDRLRAAVEESGFRFEAQKIPVQTTIIDRAERPTEN